MEVTTQQSKMKLKWIKVEEKLKSMPP